MVENLYRRISGVGLLSLALRRREIWACAGDFRGEEKWLTSGMRPSGPGGGPVGEGGEGGVSGVGSWNLSCLLGVPGVPRCVPSMINTYKYRHTEKGRMRLIIKR